jgi:hypothetical protein
VLLTSRGKLTPATAAAFLGVRLRTTQRHVCPNLLGAIHHSQEQAGGAFTSWEILVLLGFSRLSRPNWFLSGASRAPIPSTDPEEGFVATEKLVPGIPFRQRDVSMFGI